MDALLPIALLLSVATAFVAWRTRQRGIRRQRVVSGLLDSADALEARLRAARGEIEAIAGDDKNPVLGAMQDILRQRLWLQDHAVNADLAQLQAVRDALDQASAHLDQQLGQIARARGGA